MNARANKVGLQDVQRNWTWLLGLGILFVILGCIGLSMVVGLTIVSMLFFGILLIIGGASQIVDVFKAHKWRGVLWHAVVAVLYLVGGGIVLYDPLLASALITAMLAGTLIVIGMTRLMMAFSMKNSAGWVWILIAGLIAILLGLMILMQWPVSGLWVIGLFIAVEILVTGWSYIFFALSFRKAS